MAKCYHTFDQLKGLTFKLTLVVGSVSLAYQKYNNKTNLQTKSLGKKLPSRSPTASPFHLMLIFEFNIQRQRAGFYVSLDA